MYKKALSVMLVSFLIQVICVKQVLAVVPANTETLRIARMKERIGEIQLEKKRAVVTLRDKTKLTGRIGEVRETSFSIADERTNATIEVR